MIKLFSALLCFCLSFSVLAQKNKQYTVSSPDGAIKVLIETGTSVHWSVKHGATTVLAPSPLSLTLWVAKYWEGMQQ